MVLSKLCVCNNLPGRIGVLHRGDRVAAADRAIHAHLIATVLRRIRLHHVSMQKRRSAHPQLELLLMDDVAEKHRVLRRSSGELGMKVCDTCGIDRRHSNHRECELLNAHL